MKLNLAAILVLLMVIISALMAVPLDRSNRQVAAADKSRLSLNEKTIFVNPYISIVFQFTFSLSIIAFISKKKGRN